MKPLGNDHRDIVLLVDDSPGTLSLLTEALEQAGLTVLVARDGTTALSLLERIEPDMILMDAVMPGLDGFDTCARIKDTSRLADVPVVFMTGLGTPEHIVRGFDAGGVDYVTKPVSPEALIARISVHMANARILREARAALDNGGQGVLALQGDGTVHWTSPRAEELIPPARVARAAATLRTWLADLERSGGTGPQTLLLGPEGADPALQLSYLGRTSSGDHLARVTTAGDPPDVELSRSLMLTRREGEVLHWLAKGKSNRDIAAILEISPRTINKHLEQIYAKIGVENRTAAVSVALRHLAGLDP